MAEQIKHYEILKKPVLTENTLKMYQEQHKVTIEVDVRASRDEVKRAFEIAFPGTKVEKVNIIVSKPRTVRRGRFVGKIGKKKKAIIKLSSNTDVNIYNMEAE
ncbi:MAG: 50S ribosomal protein L23 [Bacilli bacterium]|jgi:large subunit ribosomal protein L23|nr:50S ribosomal protein L23 [Bacilli bacterium]